MIFSRACICASLAAYCSTNLAEKEQTRRVIIVCGRWQDVKNEVLLKERNIVEDEIFLFIFLQNSPLL